ncbi:MAG: Cysteine desulfuration protein SufE [Crocinitomicaceae bacterium]|jgi:cysteine desulfuration protein SufE|nr:Cysteine desulfuration protein SufE [Crocinitomicaceae bacterium]
MTLEDKQQAIVEEFALFDDWMQKYEYLIEMGKDLPKIDDSKKTEDRIIEGCQSKVWLDARYEDGKMKFSADSDAIITKGIIGLLIQVLDEEKPEDIVKSDLHFINDIGLHEHLSPTRSNGLASMVKKMKMEALRNC